MAITVAVFTAVVIFALPLVFMPRIRVPTGLQYATPSSMEFRIENQNFTPLTDVDYVCQISKLTVANGSTLEGATAVIRGRIRKIPGRRSVLGRCETGSIVAAPIKSAEYKLTVNYKAYPWPQQRTVVHQIDAEVSGKGEVTGWKLE